MAETFRLHRIVPVIALLLLAWFAAAMLHEATFKELLYDDAYNASVAKNFSLGQGWVSSYHQYIPFNPRVTTGPTLLLPLATAIALIGHPAWLPSVINTLLMLAVLLLCLRQVQQQLDQSQRWPVIATILLLLSMYDRNTWVVFIGDGVLALLLVYLLLKLGPALSRNQPADYLVLGLAAGLAILSKLYAVIALTALPLCWCLYQWQTGTRPDWRGPALLLSAAAALLAPWQLYRYLSLATLPAPLLADHGEFSRQFFLKAGSGLGPLLAADKPLAYLAANLQRNFSLLSDHLDIYGLGPVFAALLLLTVAGVGLRLVFKPGKTSLEWSLTALALAAGAHLGWFLLFMHSPWIHYARIPLLLSIFLLPLYFSHWLKGRAVMMLTLLLLVSLPQLKQQDWANFATLQAQPGQGTEDLSALISALETTAYPAPLAGCGWLVPRMLEYRLAGSLHMQDCMLLLKAKLPAQIEPDGNGSVKLVEPVVFTIPMHNFLWDWAGRGHKMERSIKQYCQPSLYHNHNYSILPCKVSAVSPQLARYLQSYRLRS
jgi:hypothetical protein